MTLRTISGTFSAAGKSLAMYVRPGDNFDVSLTFSDTGTVVLEKLVGLGAVEVVRTFTSSATVRVKSDMGGHYQLRCSTVAEEETIDYSIAEVGDELFRFETPDGVQPLKVNEDSVVVTTMTATAATVSSLSLGNDVIFLLGTASPTDGTEGTGAGSAGKGSLYIDRQAGKWYGNTGTKASPTWVELQQAS